MSSRAIKRIMKEIKLLQESNLEDENIYVSIDDNDVYHLQAFNYRT